MSKISPGPLRALLLRIPTFIAILLAFFTGDEVFPLPVIIIIVSLFYLVSGLIRKDLPTPKAISAHIALAISFVALGVITLLASGPLSYYIMAGAWTLHALWDVYLFRKNIVAPRWVTEFCIVYDLLVALLLVLAALRL